MKQGTTRRFGHPALAAALSAGLAFTGVAAVANGASAAVQAKGSLGPYGYGGVRLGMTATEAKATGKIVKKTGGASGCSGWDLKAYPTGQDSVGLYISKKRGVAAIFAAKGVTTPEGIGLGSTAKQLKRAYPKLKESASGYPFTVVPGNSKAQYLFLLSRGKVTEVALSLRNQDCFN